MQVTATPARLGKNQLRCKFQGISMSTTLIYSSRVSEDRDQMEWQDFWQVAAASMLRGDSRLTSGAITCQTGLCNHPSATRTWRARSINIWMLLMRLCTLECWNDESITCISRNVPISYIRNRFMRFNIHISSWLKNAKSASESQPSAQNQRILATKKLSLDKWMEKPHETKTAMTQRKSWNISGSEGQRVNSFSNLICANHVPSLGSFVNAINILHQTRHIQQ